MFIVEGVINFASVTYSTWSNGSVRHNEEMFKLGDTVSVKEIRRTMKIKGKPIDQALGQSQNACE